MRGTDETSGSLFSYVDLEARIPARHPLRKIRQVVNDALASLDGEFDALYTDFGRPSIPPERLIRASLIQILFSIRSERQLRRCCITLTSKDSHCESMRLDGMHEQAITRPLSHNELVQLHGFSAQARIVADLAGQGDDLARAA